MLVLIAFVPILEIAKLASAFQILVFAVVNLAVIAFREGAPEYEPSFRSPFYSWLQIFGTISGPASLTQMGTVPLIGAAVVVVGSLVWYLGYVRDRVDRKGAARNAVRRWIGRGASSDARALIDESEGTLTTGATESELPVALTGETTRERERSLLGIAADLAAPRDGRVVVVRFDEVNDQVPLEYAAEVQSPADVTFEERTDGLAEEFDVPIGYGEIVSHDTKRAMINLADHRGVDTILTERERLRLRSRLVGDPIDWVVRHAPCDVILTDLAGYERPKRIVLAGDETEYDPTTVAVADAIAGRTGGTVALAGGGEDAYRSELAGVVSAPVDARSVRSDGGNVPGATVVVRRGVADSLFGRRDREPRTDDDVTELTVYPHAARSPGRLRRVARRLVS